MITPPSKSPFFPYTPLSPSISHPYFLMSTDLTPPRAAIAEARAAEANGEVPVGAVVVHENKIIGRGQNRVLRDSDPTAHAEIVALREACRTLNNYRLEDCTLYATLETCAICAVPILPSHLSRL